MMAAADPLVKQNYNNDGPLNQNLILKLVLEHVGRADTADLKNCRLVNHSWNRAAVLVLEQQHDSALQLGFGRLLEFKHLLWNTELSRTKEADQQRELTSLRLSLTLNSHSTQLNENFISSAFGHPRPRTEKSFSPSQTSMAAQLLMLNPHLSVAFIDYKCTHEPHQIFYDLGLIEMDDSLVNRELFSLLRLCSRSLVGFRLRCDNVRFRPNFEDFDFDSYQPLTFLNLTILCYKMAYYSEEGRDGDERNEEMLDLTRHVLAVIQGAPKLSKLSLDIWEGSVEGTANSVRGILEGCSAHLEQLEITEGERGREDIFKVLTELQFPLLTLVKMENGFFFTNNTFNKFLTHSCPALTSLKVEWSDVFRVGEDSVLEFRFPLLPKIVHFELQLLYCVRSYRVYDRYLQRVYFTFNTLLRNFPSLNSLTIDLGVLFMLGAHLGRSGQLVPEEQWPVFPNICSLEICIREVHENLLPMMDMGTRIYQHTFPNMEKLVIKPADECMSSCREVKQNLDRAIQFVCFHPGIRVLEIHNYASAWMDRIVNSRHVSRSLEGLKSLKLIPPRERSSRRTPPQMKLMELITKFPSLEFLQFGNQIASRAELESVRAIVKKFEQPISN